MPPVTLRKATSEFLERVPLFASFSKTANLSAYGDVPADWFLFVSDIRGSTKATEQGRYKEVNVVGASAVMAVLNRVKPHETFYVFGGDGATFLCPPELADDMTEALLGARILAREQFKFELRVGKVPLAALYASGAEVKVARFRVSSTVTQAALAGDGLGQAEALVKKPPPGENYEVTESSSSVAANTEGLECRWNPVDSKRGQMTSIIVQSLNLDPKRAENDYREILDLVDALFTDAERPTVSRDGLALATNPRAYLAEAKSRSGGKPWFSVYWYALKAFAVTLAARVLWKNFYKAFGEKYQSELVENTDYRKFDGVLRMVLDLSSEQLKRLQALLEKKSANDEVAYGIHLSKSALMTCLVFDRSKGNHLHFVDGNDGGYSAAAKVLKKKLSDRNERICSIKPKRAAG